ncbi:mCG1046239, partial [Mus musculus]
QPLGADNTEEQGSQGAPRITALQACRCKANETVSEPQSCKSLWWLLTPAPGVSVCFSASLEPPDRPYNCFSLMRAAFPSKRPDLVISP